MKLFGGKKEHKKITGRVKILIAIGSVCIAVLMVMGAIKLLFRPPERNLSGNETEQGDIVTMSPPPRTGTEDGPEPDSTESPKMDERYYTFTLAGVDLDDYHTDTILVARYDAVDNKLNLVSIPRDTMVNVSRSIKKINSAYGLGNSKDGKGVSYLRSELQSLIGFAPEYSVIVNLEGFVELIDALGGVYYDVPRNMYHPADLEYPELNIDLQKGYQLLDGNHALQLVRYRSYPEGDLKRVEVQQSFLKETAKQILQLGNLFKYQDFVEILDEYVKTELDIGNMGWFAMKFMGMKAEDIQFYTLPCDTGYYQGSASNKQSYAYIEVDKALELINETINPLSRPITKEDLNILRLED